MRPRAQFRYVRELFSLVAFLLDVFFCFFFQIMRVGRVFRGGIEQGVDNANDRCPSTTRRYNLLLRNCDPSLLVACSSFFVLFLFICRSCILSTCVSLLALIFIPSERTPTFHHRILCSRSASNMFSARGWGARRSRGTTSFASANCGRVEMRQTKKAMCRIRVFSEFLESWREKDVQWALSAKR